MVLSELTGLHGEKPISEGRKKYWGERTRGGLGGFCLDRTNLTFDSKFNYLARGSKRLRLVFKRFNASRLKRRGGSRKTSRSTTPRKVLLGRRSALKEAGIRERVGKFLRGGVMENWFTG